MDLKFCTWVDPIQLFWSPTFPIIVMTLRAPAPTREAVGIVQSGCSGKCDTHISHNQIWMKPLLAFLYSNFEKSFIGFLDWLYHIFIDVFLALIHFARFCVELIHICYNLLKYCWKCLLFGLGNICTWAWLIWLIKLGIRISWWEYLYLGLLGFFPLHFYSFISEMEISAILFGMVWNCHQDQSCKRRQGDFEAPPTSPA